MADRKETISQQPTATTMDGSELVPFVQGGVTKKGRVDLLLPTVSAKWFGARGDGTSDDTAAINAAMTWLEGRGGGTILFPKGTYLVSMAAAAHAFACVRIPANVTIQGDGMYVTTFTRPASERGTNGILFVNKYYDAVGSYGAAGNITIRDCGFTDGATTPNRALGDLIGFGNGDGLKVYDCYFGNHDQHGVDICRSRNWEVRGCISSNDVAQSASATYQIDAGLIDGIFGSSMPSYNGKIHDCSILKSRSQNVIHFHTANQARNVEIFDNYIDGTFCPNGANAIGGDTDCTYDGVDIHHNYIVMANVTCRCINFPTLEDLGTGVVKGLRIYNNWLRGSFRIGCFAGDDSAALAAYTGALNSVEIYDNDIEMNTSTGTLDSTARAVGVSLFKYSRIEGNVIRWIGGGVAQAQQVRLISDIGCQYSTIHRNRIERDTPDGTGTSYGVYVDFLKAYTNSLPTVKIVEANHFDGAGFDYLVFFADHGTMDSYLGYAGSRISRNTWPLGLSVVSAHMKEVFPASDGTNNLQYINFTGQPNVVAADATILNIQQNTTYTNVPWVGTKQGKDGNQRLGKVTCDLVFTASGVAGFGANVESLTCAWTSATTCMGTIVRNIDLQNNHFDIVTGVSGVSMYISDTTHQPVARTSGHLRILAGI